MYDRVQGSGLTVLDGHSPHATWSRRAVDDINPYHHLKDPKLWELWYVPLLWVMLRIYIINRSALKP